MEPTRSPATIEDPDAKSSAILGAVSACIFMLPVASIASIVLGIVAVGKAGRGKEAIERSGGALRGKGAHIAGKIMGICGIVFGALFTLYYLVMVFGLLFLSRAAIKF